MLRLHDAIKRIALLTSSASLAFNGAAAQQVPSRGLPAPDAQVGPSFNRITAVRELADGRVLLADEGDNQLMIVDFRSRSSRQVGRDGGGAGEYRTARRLLPLAADSSLLVDPANGRWLLIARDSIVGIIGPSATVVRLIGSPLGADSGGSVIGARPRLAGGTVRIDSTILLRASRTHDRVDTLGALLNRRPNLPGGRIDPTQAVPVTFNPLAAGEQAVMFADGWIAVARLSPYRVEWYPPAGPGVVGAPLPFEPIRVDDREKVAAVERESRATAREPRDINAVGDWPAVVPPFLANALLAAPDGSLWIQRASSRDQSRTRYDVVDRRGVIMGRFDLDESERVVGFGVSSVYSTRVDSDGQQTIRRHAMPRR